MSTRTQRPPRGQIIVVFALGLIAIALTVGLVVDGGTAFLQRRDGQNDADLAALAGTKVIADAWIRPSSPPGFAPLPSRGAVFDAISRRMIESGCVAGGTAPCTWTAQFVGAGATDLWPVTAGDSAPVSGSKPAILGVRVDVTLHPRTFFLGLVGQTSWRVDTTATALTAKPLNAPPSQLLPMALMDPGPDAPFQAGQVYDLIPDKIAPGGFAWINWKGSSSSAVADSTCSPNNSTFALGTTTVKRAPSNSDWGRVRSCLSAWMTSRATVLVPIYSPKSTPPNYRITGVAAFTLESIDRPANGDVRATFVGTYAYPTAPIGASQPPSAEDSLYYLGLVR